MKYISITEVLNLNKIIKEANLPYLIHLRDACGKQSLWIEFLEESASAEQNRGSLDQILKEYFDGLRFTIEFSEDKINFWITAN